MKIIIDTYGVDDGIKIPIEGAISALKEKDFVPVFSGDGKVEMVGSDSKHEFPRCDGHVGRILRNNRCKKTDW